MAHMLVLRNALIGAVGDALGIAIIIGLAALADIPLLAVPFTTLIVLVIAAPKISRPSRAISWVVTYCPYSAD